jgi:hypothetical protein
VIILLGIHVFHALILHFVFFKYIYIELNHCLNFFFCFRWLLILFKREYSLEQILSLWEIWSCPFTPHFDLFVACAMLMHYRKRILTETTGFDDMLLLMHELSHQFDVFHVIDTAEHLYRYLKSLPIHSIPYELHYITMENVSLS